jgi:tetratricopeptide (TPR) repeat protein
LQLERDEQTLTRIAERSLIQNIFVGFNNIWLYVAKLFFPGSLSYFYLPIRNYPVAGSALGISVTTLLSYLAWKYRHSFPLLLWAWGSFLVILLPVAGFMVAGEANAPDRYSYLAYTGPFLLLSVFVQRALSQLKCSKAKQQFAGLVLGCLVLFTLTFFSLKRAAVWRNMETLTMAAIKTDPNNYAAHHHLALYYLQQGMTGKSLPHLERSLELNPKNPVLWGKLGVIEYMAGQPQQAKGYFAEQLIHSPDNLDSHLGLVKIYSENRQFSKAIPHLERMVQLSPENKLYQQTLQQYRTSQGD